MRIFLLIMLISAHVSCAQKKNSEKVVVNGDRDYTIPNEDQIYDMSWVKAPNDTIRADLRIKINGKDSSKMGFCKAKLQNDTLKITIRGLSSSEFNEYIIYIHNQNYTIKFRNLIDALPEEEIIADKMKLMINSQHSKRGSVLRGYTEFEGRCKKPCTNAVISIIGNFKCVIR